MKRHCLRSMRFVGRGFSPSHNSQLGLSGLRQTWCGPEEFEEVWAAPGWVWGLTKAGACPWAGEKYGRRFSARPLAGKRKKRMTKNSNLHFLLRLLQLLPALPRPPPSAERVGLRHPALRALCCMMPFHPWNPCFLSQVRGASLEFPQPSLPDLASGCEEVFRKAKQRAAPAASLNECPSRPWTANPQTAPSSSQCTLLSACVAS